MTAISKYLSAHSIHYVWDNSIPPALTVESGEVFAISLRDAADRQLKPGTSPAKLRNLDLSGFWALSGPVAVAGARPGDAVQIDVRELRVGSWGWTAIFPERGLLREEIKGPYLHHWELPEHGEYADLRRGVRVPLSPFLGVIGCAPADAGTSSPVQPRPHGGKLDLPQLTAGSSLVLPVQTAGALLSFGHGRAAQGNGEVCGSGLECDMTAVLRATILPKRAPKEPYALLQAPPATIPGPYRMTMASAPNLLEASRAATRQMIGWLTAEHRLSRELAYILCSVAADLRIAQAVNTPNGTVSLSLPLSIFV